ncbi:hypothetical protein M758_8G119400 [Ceratodon purpureus]|nr:hypothetical protein M758_8G119400 [Ceratodon purpureus]
MRLHELTFVFLCSRWEKPGYSLRFGYDFWYQPRHKTMISSSWGAPLAFTEGFDPSHVADGLYGQHLFVYDWPEGTLKQTLDLGNTGLIPLEICRELIYFYWWQYESNYICSSFFRLHDTQWTQCANYLATSLV